MNTTVFTNDRKKTSNKIRNAASLAGLVLAMGTSLSAVAGSFEYDPNVGLTSEHQCGVGETRFISTSDVTNGGSDASHCFGAYDGNNNFGPLKWGDKSWNQIAKLDVEGNDQIQSGSGITLNFGNDDLSNGDWSFSGDTSQWDSFFVVTKAANSPGWAAYFFDDILLNSDLNGTFSIPWSGGKSDNPADLSHLSLYAKHKVTVPEPATLGLLGLGLLALGMRRKH